MISIDSIGQSKKANGTSLTGYINVSYRKLVELFGEPMGPSSDNKVDAEWHVLIKDRGEEVGFATIYNYKNGKAYCGEALGLHVEDIDNWHVGSKHQHDFWYLEDYIKNHG